MERGASVVVHRIDGPLHVLMENSEWPTMQLWGARVRAPVSVALLAWTRCGCTQSRACRQLPRPRLRWRMIPCGSWRNTLSLPPSRGRPASSAACHWPAPLLLALKVPVYLVAPAGCGHPAENVVVEVYVLPRPTTRLGIFVLASQVPALIAFVRYELMALKRESAPA